MRSFKALQTVQLHVRFSWMSALIHAILLVHCTVLLLCARTLRHTYCLVYRRAQSMGISSVGGRLGNMLAPFSNLVVSSFFFTLLHQKLLAHTNTDEFRLRCHACEYPWLPGIMLLGTLFNVVTGHSVARRASYRGYRAFCC